MTQSNIYVAADYADALLVARRGKNTLFILLLLSLLLELGLFFAMRFSKHLPPFTGPAATHGAQLLQYAIGLIDFMGLILPVVFGVTICLILHIMLVGRLVGTAEMMSAFLWTVVLAALLFPWQSALNNPATTNDPATAALGVKIPGVLYTWTELTHDRMGAQFSNSGDLAFLILRWARFAGFPVLSLLILVAIQIKSNRGLRRALGTETVLAPETLPDVER